jgi:NAD-dependent dihydropyrimidine dehydrogenase PreA subunit
MGAIRQADGGRIGECSSGPHDGHIGRCHVQGRPRSRSPRCAAGHLIGDKPFLAGAESRCGSAAPTAIRLEADLVLEDLTVAYVIAQPCIDNSDRSCVEVCPVDCITADPSIDRKFYVDPDGCIDCGSCETACPNEAIFRADRLLPRWVDFAWIDRTWYQDQAAAREAVDVASSAA